MNAYGRTSALLSGEQPDHLPCQPIFMTFAARIAGVPYSRYVMDYRSLVYAQIRLAAEFDIDVVSCCSDAWREASDCGAELVVFDDAPPACRTHLLAEKSRLLSLTAPSPTDGPRMSDRVKAVALFAERVKGDIPIMGWVEGPVAQAADLRGINELMVDTLDDPSFVQDLFSFVTALEIEFARAQIRAGADIIGVGDAASSLLSPHYYEEHVLPHARRLIGEIHDEGVPVRLHVCGDTRHLLSLFARLKPDIVDIDYPVPMAVARGGLGAGPVLSGNLNPVSVVRNATPAAVKEACAACYAEAGPRYIVGAGCEIPPDTPHANVRAMVEFAREAV